MKYNSKSLVPDNAGIQKISITALLACLILGFIAGWGFCEFIVKATSVSDRWPPLLRHGIN
ncbi:MAG TPA: hypothetical protein VNS58_06125 [Puia sp.]|nr:hypothetical protein [Puia sp.]